jgi:hypothetical protein
VQRYDKQSQKRGGKVTYRQHYFRRFKSSREKWGGSWSRVELRRESRNEFADADRTVGVVIADM